MDVVTIALRAWENFYVIIGSSAGALIGLQFVVMTLIKDSGGARSTREIDAFGTPTVIHFMAVLVVSLIQSAPWPGSESLRVSIGCCGLAGSVYVAIVIRRMRGQDGYQPVAEDWAWHAVLPLVAYLVLLGTAGMMHASLSGSLFAVAVSALLLLCIGIHNAWDTVTYVAVGGLQSGKSTEQAPVSGDLTP
ncbi:MAG TPA: hypothetical protein VGH34_12535 [Vicinamibacterales bacterium]|jgi:hypothetical protein